MKKFTLTALSIVLVMMLLDGLWIGLIARSLYVDGIGHLMSTDVRWGAALLFYGVYAVGIIELIVKPSLVSFSGSSMVFRAALLGLCAYSTYDLTNLATLKDWPVLITVVDIFWGMFVTVLCALTARKVWFSIK